MHTAIIALTLGLVGPPTESSHQPIETTEFQAPAQPTILNVDSDDVERSNGTRARWVEVTYELSTGQEAQAFVEADERGHGDVVIYVEGEPLIRAAVDGHRVTHTWSDREIDLAPEVLTELMGGAVATEVFSGIAKETHGKPCSKWIRVAKYAYFAALGVAEVICCTGGTLVGCSVCTGLGLVAAAAGDDIEEDYCG